MAVTISDSSSAFSLSAVASTLEHMRTVIRDNVSDSTALLSFLMGRLGRSRRQLSNFQNTDGLPGVFMGGRDIRVPVQLSLNQTVGSYAGTDTLDITHQDTDNYALYPIRQVSGSLVLIGRDMRGNKGASAIYSLLESKVMNLENSLRMNINEQAVADGTGNGGKDLDGLAAIVGTGTLAGLNPATYPAWRPAESAAGDSATARTGVDNTSEDFDSVDTLGGATANNTDGMIRMRNVYHAVSYGQDKPDGIFSGENYFKQYEVALVPQVRYQDVQEANQGFESLFFEGAAWFIDRDIPSTHVYLLNSRHIAFMRDSEADFVWLDDLQRPVDQDVLVRHMIVEGNIVTDNRRMLGACTALT